MAGLDITEPPPEYEEPAGSLAALVLSVVSSRLGTTEQTLTHGRFDRTADRICYLLVAAGADRIAEYAKGLEGQFPAFSRPEIVLDLRDWLVADDPLADAVHALDDKGICATATGRTISLTTAVPDPYAPACEALALATAASPVVIRARRRKGWVTLLWRAPDLVVVRPGAKPGTVFSNVYRYPTGTSPATDIRTTGRPSSDRNVEQTMAGQPLPSIAIDILGVVRLDEAELGVP